MPSTSQEGDDDAMHVHSEKQTDAVQARSYSIARMWNLIRISNHRKEGRFSIYFFHMVETFFGCLETEGMMMCECAPCS
jgi:hypothetical protein